MAYEILESPKNRCNYFLEWLQKTLDTRVQSTNHPTSQRQERVVGTLMEVGNGEIVETIFLTRTFGMWRQGFFIDLTTDKWDSSDYLIIYLSCWYCLQSCNISPYPSIYPSSDRYTKDIFRIISFNINYLRGLNSQMR